ncbi:hypothetical protein SAMN05660473_02524 [Arthrobacter sp. 49Tsu3.1M3]|nr:hypothetical protein SAMN05660473_02524 [Arthrobacter sp. 49Tsu3.1M3]
MQHHDFAGVAVTAGDSGAPLSSSERDFRASVIWKIDLYLAAYRYHVRYVLMRFIGVVRFELWSRRRLGARSPCATGTLCGKGSSVLGRPASSTRARGSSFAAAAPARELGRSSTPSWSLTSQTACSMSATPWWSRPPTIPGTWPLSRSTIVAIHGSCRIYDPDPWLRKYLNDRNQCSSMQMHGRSHPLPAGDHADFGQPGPDYSPGHRERGGGFGISTAGTDNRFNNFVPRSLLSFCNKLAPAPAQG